MRSSPPSTKEAQKYVGTPYVWGGSTPETGFDCSGYVCWVYNQNGYNVGRTTANGLWNKSQHISEAEAKPGDLVFFEGTYDTPGKSHNGNRASSKDDSRSRERRLWLRYYPAKQRGNPPALPKIERCTGKEHGRKAASCLKTIGHD